MSHTGSRSPSPSRSRKSPLRRRDSEDLPTFGDPDEQQDSFDDEIPEDFDDEEIPEDEHQPHNEDWQALSREQLLAMGIDPDEGIVSDLRQVSAPSEALVLDDDEIADAHSASKREKLVEESTTTGMTLDTHPDFGVNSSFLELLPFEDFDDVVAKHPEIFPLTITTTATVPLGARATMRAWLKSSDLLDAASGPEEILATALKHPTPADPALWAAIAEVVGVIPGTWNEVLARATLMDGSIMSVPLQKKIKAFCTKHKLDHSLYQGSLRGDGYTLFGLGEAEMGMRIAPSSFVDRIHRLTEARLKDRHTSAREGELTGRTMKLREVDDSEQHALDRLAWILATLRSSRECVAVAKLASRELRLFANVSDPQMIKDFQTLMDAATASVGDLDQLTKALYERMADRTKRGKELDAWDLRQMERRLRKTLNYLQVLSGQWQDMRVIAHNSQFTGGPKDGGTQKVHAETQAGTTVVRKVDLDTGKSSLPKKGKMPKRRKSQAGAYQDLERVRTTAEKLLGEVDQAAAARRLKETQVAIGISKLCCFYCWLMLGALANTKGVAITISGTHFKTYGWPVPEALTSEEVLTAFLGLDGPVTGDALELKNHLKTVEGRAAVVDAIKRTPLGAGEQETGYASSEDEGDTPYKPKAYTLSKTPVGERPSKAKKKKAKQITKIETDTGAEPATSTQVMETEPDFSKATVTADPETLKIRIKLPRRAMTMTPVKLHSPYDSGVDKPRNIRKRKKDEDLVDKRAKEAAQGKLRRSRRKGVRDTSLKIMKTTEELRKPEDSDEET